MNSAVSRLLICVMIVLSFAVQCASEEIASGASEEVSVTVKFTGSIDELMDVLESLQALGIGEKQAASVNEPVRVQMHSVATNSASPPAPVQLPQAAGSISLSQATVVPAQARPGDSVLVSVRVVDPRGDVDTVAATLHGVNGFMFDLYDNGTHGDTTRGDGVWSYALEIPTLAGAKTYRVIVTAYDRSGDIIEHENAKGVPAPLTTETRLGIAR